MKKIYLAPATNVIAINVTTHILDASVTQEEASTTAVSLSREGKGGFFDEE